MVDSPTAYQKEPMLSVRDIHKSFALNSVLKGIYMDVRPGEVMALIGGNGAGKSTLMKIIMGIYQQDRGEIFVAGQKVNLSKPSAALAQGIYLVPQEPMLFPNMTVEENIVIGFTQGKAELHKRLLALIGQLGWHLDLGRRASSLSIAEQQLVEILRGLLRDSRILILDEPTSALTFDEVRSLFKIIEGLKEKQISIIYITHRLNEVFEIATHVAIMRDGIITMNDVVGKFTKEILVKGLLPPDTQLKGQSGGRPLPAYGETEPVFRLENFSGYGFSDITMAVYPGEILGLAGVVGAGRTELAVTIFGKDAVKNGRAILGGEDVTGLSTRAVIGKGIMYVPEDRHLNGIFNISSVAVNMTASCLDDMGGVFFDYKQERLLTEQYIKDFRIKVTGQDQLIGSLSGGNQQKVVIGRALAAKPKLVILDEPTRGIDAAARGDVYAIIHALRDQGVAILLISSDMEEIVELSDRAVTMYQGRLNHSFEKSEITEDNLMAAAFGVYGGGEKVG